MSARNSISFAFELQIKAPGCCALLQMKHGDLVSCISADKSEKPSQFLNPEKTWEDGFCSQCTEVATFTKFLRAVVGHFANVFSYLWTHVGVIRLHDCLAFMTLAEKMRSVSDRRESAGIFLACMDFRLDRLTRRCSIKTLFFSLLRKNTVPFSVLVVLCFMEKSLHSTQQKCANQLDAVWVSTKRRKESKLKKITPA